MSVQSESISFCILLPLSIFEMSRQEFKKASSRLNGMYLNSFILSFNLSFAISFIFLFYVYYSCLLFLFFNFIFGDFIITSYI